MNKKELDEYVSQQLAIARKKVNLTQSEVADKISVANSSIVGRYETTDRQPNLYNLYKMSELYNTDMNFYFPKKENDVNKEIPVYVVIPNISDLDKIKKATSMLTISNDYENSSNCFAYIVDSENSNSNIRQDDIIIFERTEIIKDDGLYLLKIKGKEQQTIISNITIQDNYYILYLNNKPTVMKKQEIIPLGRAIELRHKF